MERISQVRGGEGMIKHLSFHEWGKGREAFFMSCDLAIAVKGQTGRRVLRRVNRSFKLMRSS